MLPLSLVIGFSGTVVYGATMFGFRCGVGALAVLILAVPAAGQLVRERFEDGRRVCVYNVPPVGLGDARGEMATSVPFGQNCPERFPLRQGSGPLPPYAQLYDSTTDGGQRHCRYVLGGEQWINTVGIGTWCPSSASMLPSDEEREADRIR